MKYFLPFLIFIFCLDGVNAQSNDTEAAIYNVGFGAVFSTVGAIINKSPEEKLGKVITKALWQGALGGYVTFESKRLLREAERQDEWKYFWIAKLVNASGTSIKENAALNNDFYDRWHINIGFSRIEFNTKDKFTVNYKLMPVAFVFTADAFFRYDFDFGKSFRNAELTFLNDGLIGDRVAGSSAGYIVYQKSFRNNKGLVIHETIHQYQSNDFSIFNTYTVKSVSKWINGNSTLKWFNKHVYPEYHYLLLRPLYVIERDNAVNYFDNFFEQEAEYYGQPFGN